MWSPEQLDLFLLKTVNQTWTTSFFDQFFPVWTDFHKTSIFIWLLFPLIVLVSFYYARWSGPIFVFAAAATVGICDGICGKLIKHLFERPRPSVAGVDVILRAPHFGGFSFPSNHSANMFCLWAFAGFFFPRLRWPLFLIAFLTAYSRVYCGVHYPSDVLGGALIGGLIGLASAWLFRKPWASIQRRWSGKRS